VSVASWAVKNKREREGNRVELCYIACPGCIDLDARDCDREREREVETLFQMVSLIHKHRGTGERTGQCLSVKQ